MVYAVAIECHRVIHVQLESEFCLFNFFNFLLSLVQILLRPMMEFLLLPGKGDFFNS